jgi:integrase
MVQELRAAGQASAETSNTRCVDTHPTFDTRTLTAIENTVYTCECSGRCNKTTIEKHKKRLLKLATQTNLFDSRATARHILNLQRSQNPTYKNAKPNTKPLCKRYIKNLLDTYAVFCMSNQIPYDKPRVRTEKPIQIIPTTDQVTKIIGASSSKYSTIFTIMSQTGAEGEELRQTPRDQIDLDQGIISLTGTKGHNNGIFPLRTRTAQLLREYIAKQTSQTKYPFPKPKALGETWRRARIEASKKFNEPELAKIPLKNLRNYAGAIFYKTTGKHDFMATMRFMRHKRPETTLDYIRTINLDEPEEYITVAIQTGTPDTQKRIIEYSNAGYTKFTEADGYQYFRILKALTQQING